MKEFAKHWKENLAARANGASLVIVQVGNNEASNRYVRNKVKDCDEVGIRAEVKHCDENITTMSLCKAIYDWQREVDGIIVQLPLPPHINFEIVKNVIDPMKDVDGFVLGSKFNPCTPLGIVTYLRETGFPIEGSRVAIIGRSELVGKPLARMLTDADATVTLYHSKSKPYWLEENYDLIVCAVGKARFLNCWSIKCPVIDVGINFDENGKMVGDCFNTEGRNVSPVPGGVGLLTRCALLENVIKAKEEREK